jgi:ATP-dependent Lon protease
MSELGLFPLGMVLLPGEQVPLHIFEPRYRELIGECVEHETPFGLVLADDEGMRDVGTEARVIEVVEELEDGRMNIVVEGGGRFRVVEVSEERSFATAEVADVVDDGGDPTREELDRCVAAYDRVIKAAEADIDELDPDGGSVSFQIGARVDLGVEVKQDLLELRSERDRVVMLTPLLDRAAEAVRRDREIRERASTNGHVDSF